MFLERGPDGPPPRRPSALVGGWWTPAGASCRSRRAYRLPSSPSGQPSQGPMPAECISTDQELAGWIRNRTMTSHSDELNLARGSRRTLNRWWPRPGNDRPLHSHPAMVPMPFGVFSAIGWCSGSPADSCAGGPSRPSTSCRSSLRPGWSHPSGPRSASRKSSSDNVVHVRATTTDLRPYIDAFARLLTTVMTWFWGTSYGFPNPNR